MSERGRETGRGDRGEERKETERWGRGGRDDLTKLKAFVVSEEERGDRHGGDRAGLRLVLTAC